MMTGGWPAICANRRCGNCRQLVMHRKNMNTKSHTIVIAGIVSLMLIGCHSDNDVSNAPKITSITIESHPQGWGLALKTLQTDGTIYGTHLSGGPNVPPMVYQSSTKISAEDMETIKELTKNISWKPGDVNQRPDKKTEGFKSIMIGYDDHTCINVYAKWNDQFHPDTWQSIWDIIYKYKAGAW